MKSEEHNSTAGSPAGSPAGKTTAQPVAQSAGNPAGKTTAKTIARPMTGAQKNRRIIVALCAIVAGIALIVGGVTFLSKKDSTAGKDAVAVGGTFEFVSPGGQTSISYPAEQRRKINDFHGKHLLDGSTISLNDYAGQVVVLNSWGQWCGPCRSESDDLQTVHDKLQQAQAGTVLGINVKDPIQAKAQDFVRDNGITFPSIYDPPFKTALAFGGLPASVIPTTIVLDKQHRPAHIFLKEVTDKELWEVVEPLLAE